jgi:hypothetical protein
MAAGDFNGTTQYFIGGSAPVSAVPLTMACWFRGNSTLTGALMSLSTNGGTARYSLVAAGTIGGDPIQAGATNSAGTGANAVTSTGFTSGVWHHAAGVSRPPSDRAAFIDGGSKGTETTSITAGADRTLIGARISTTVGAFFTGRIAEAAIWNTNLSDDEVAILAKGFSPQQVRPSALVFYAPLLPTANDLSRGLSLTNTASVGFLDGPRIYGL